MRTLINGLILWIVGCLPQAVLLPVLWGEEIVDPVSDSGLRCYAQGGVVVDGIAYFTSSDGGGVKTDEPDAFPAVVAFDVKTFKKLRTYRFARTYDSSPFLFQKKDGTWLIIAHEHLNKRTVALRRDSGEVEWKSLANQPGTYFFGHTFFERSDGTAIIYTACQNGLHATSGETGEELWWINLSSTGGITPCVDQANGWVFYQRNGQVLKLRASDGEILKTAEVDKPNVCISWNTVLVNDSHGYYVATRWYGAPAWDSALRVYDADLNLVWEKTELPHGKKSTVTYAEGRLVVGSGNAWKSDYSGDDWKHITAYSVADGDEAWKCDLAKFDYKSVLNTPYHGGYFYAETQDGDEFTSKVFRISAADGKLVGVIDYGRPLTSCATSIIAHGMILSGDLHSNGIAATLIAENSSVDWPGPFGDRQTNQLATDAATGEELVEMRELTDEHLLGEASDDVREPGAKPRKEK